MYRKNTAGQYLYFGLVNATTGAALTGATVTGKVGIDGAAQASVTGTISEDAGGQYHIALSQADTNGNNIGFLFTATNAVPVNISIVTTSANPYDAVRYGLTSLPNAAAEAAGGLYTRGTGAGQINQDANGRVDTNTAAIKGTASAGAAGYVGLDWGHITAPTTVIDLSGTTIKNLDGNTVQTGDAYAQIGLAGVGLTNIGDTRIAAIKAKTDNLPASPADETLIISATNSLATQISALPTATTVSAIKAKTDNLPATPADETVLVSAISALPTAATVASIKAKTDNLPATPADETALIAAISALPTATANATGLLDLTSGVEGGLTVRQALRLIASVLFGKASGADTTTINFRDVNDTKNRITATVDANGNRTSVTTDAT